MGRTSGLLSLLLGVAAFAAAIVFLNQDPAPPPEPEGRPPFLLPVNTAQVARGDLSPWVHLVGNVLSPSGAALSFERAGVLVAVLARPADSVDKGAELAQLSTKDEKLQVAVASADLELARQQLARLEAGEREEVLARLVAEFDERRADADLAGLEVQRGIELLADNILSRADQDRREAEFAVARARQAATEARLAEARAGTREEDLAVSESQVRVAEAKLAQAEIELEQKILTAPFDLIVVRRAVARGDFVAAGQAVFEVVNLRDLEVELEVPPQYAARISEGAEVLLTADELEGFEWRGPLSAIVPVADSTTRNVRAILRLAPDDPAIKLLRPGGFVRASVRLNVTSDALLVPADAVRTTNEGRLVARVVAGLGGPSEHGPAPPTAELVPVQLLDSDGELSAIRSLGPPLEQGDTVIVTGVDRAFPGASLLIRDREEGQ